MSALPLPNQIVAFIFAYGFCVLLAIVVMWGLIALTVSLTGEIGKTYRRYWPKKPKTPADQTGRYRFRRATDPVWPKIWTSETRSVPSSNPPERPRAH